VLTRHQPPGRARRGRAGDLARALAALCGLAALAGGVPAVLALVVGWPLPHALPSLSELSGP
jgi:hypothetical protein